MVLIRCKADIRNHAFEEHTMKKMTPVAAVGLMGLLATLVTGAHAHDGLNWSVGVSTPGAVVSVSNAPAVMWPAPVLVPARPVYMATPVVVQAPPVYLVREDKHPGKGWHKKHGHRHGHQSGQGAPVVMMQATPQVWMR